jgi:hypothetical protein
MMRELWIVITLLMAASVHARGPASEGELTFCHFGPKMKVLDPVVGKAGQAQAPRTDLCTGSAKIQGVLWECGSLDRLEGRVAGFRERLFGLARKECERHCGARAKGCVGRMEKPEKCGLETDREDAITMGKRMGCRKDCAGPHFAYCSLYDGGFRSEDPEMISKQAPNCSCAPG